VASGNESVLEEVFKQSFLETWETFVVKPEVLEPQEELKMITLPSCLLIIIRKVKFEVNVLVSNLFIYVAVL
jgi:hypothetical protein